MIKQLFLFLFILYFSNYCSGQMLDVKQYEDSLINNIIHEDNIENKFENYLEIIDFYQQSNFTKALDYCKRAHSVAKNKGNTDYALLFNLEVVKTLLYGGYLEEAEIKLQELSTDILTIKNNKVLGAYYLILNYVAQDENQLAKAHEYGLKSLKHYKLAADTSGIAKAYNNLGLSYDGIGNQQKALDYYFLAIDFAIKIQFKSVLKSAYNNLGVLYDGLGDDKQALYYYHKALDIAYQTYDKFSLSAEFNNIGLIYLGQKKYKETLRNLHKGLQISKTNNYNFDEALISSNLGEVYLELKHYDSAQYYIKRAIGIYTDLGANYNRIEVEYALAYLYKVMGNYDQSIEKYLLVIDLLKPKKYDELIENAYEQLSEIQKIKGNYKLGYDYLLTAKEISDSIGKLSIDEKLSYAEMQIDFKNTLSDYDNEFAETEHAHRIKIIKEKRIKYAIILLAILLLTFSLLLYWRFKKSHIVNELLVKRNAEVEEQKTLVEITNIELKEQYAFTETLLNTIPSPVFYTNKRGMLIGCNRAFEEVAACKEADLVGLNIKDVKKESKFYCSLCEDFTLLTEEQYHKDGVLTTAQGIKHDIIFNKKAIQEKEGTVIGILGVIIDITRVRDVERSLQQSELKLRQAINAKDKFFSIMAHDLKNPFNAILGLTHLISENFDNYKAEEVKNYAKLINQSANQIYNLLDNLLEWSRAQSGTLIKNPVIFDINEPIVECIDLLQNSLEQKSIKLTYENPKEYKVFVDKNMILTVIRNLIINAIKYTPAKGEISIRTSKVNNKVTVSITDTGIGIKDENIKKLFIIDKPISTPGLMNEKGTGLGLIICSEFITQNEGEISVQSKVNEGSVFTITLPGYSGYKNQLP